MISDFKRELDKCRLEARKNGQAATMAHFYLHCLRKIPIAETPTIQAVIHEIENQIIPQTKLTHIDPQNLQGTYVPQTLISDFQRYYQNGENIQGDIYSIILKWLLQTPVFDGDNQTDTPQYHCKRICNNYMLLPKLSNSRQRHSDMLKSYEEINDIWLRMVTKTPIVALETELKTCLEILSSAIRRNHSMIISGISQCGKSLFTRHLIKNFIERYNPHTSREFNQCKFIFIESKAFQGTENDTRNKLTELLNDLATNPQVIPVFDSFEFFLTPAIPASRLFTDYFGGIISGHCRSFIFVLRESGIRSDILNGVRRYSLPRIEPAKTLEFLISEIQKLIYDFPGFSFEKGLDSFMEQFIHLISEYYPGEAFPAIGLDIGKRFIDWYRDLFLQSDESASPKTISITDIKRFIAQEKGLTALETDFIALSNRLKEEVIAQDHVINEICLDLKISQQSKSQLKPKGRFLFVGSPGVGKTQLAKSLAYHLFGKNAFFRYNMSDFGSEGDRWRFIGSPRGYVGSEKRTIFDDVRDHPSCVILLDEIDRAHPSIQDILLSMLEGEANDGNNTTVYFSHAIFIMTTNLGQEAVISIYNDHLKSFENGLADPVSVDSTDFSDHGAIDNRTELYKNMSINLRKILLEGARDKTELKMQKAIEDQLLALRERTSYDVSHIGMYIQLNELKKRLVELTITKSHLDRAFLDRVDSILPFFPIKEPENITKILDLKLAQDGWGDCPPETKNKIFQESITESDSIRPLERLIRKYRRDQAK